ncbi:hypothetical protein MKZ12_09820 [Paenibacillus sp. FSL R5-0713]|uniref:hypothetical protein n=1 Tax=Paenibacillus sp. FSL R5-0713 TaxID=2921655 RepID=UPI0030D76742
MSTPITDSFLLLEDAENQLDLIKIGYENSAEEKEISGLFRLKIKHFLDNIRSALDYAAWQIYIEKSRNNVQERNRERHEKAIYFPVFKVKRYFDDAISNKFPGLEESSSEIINILESVQAFNTENGTNWTTYLVELSNNNKHRHLTQQIKRETVYIDNLVTNDGNVRIQGLTFVSENGSSAFGMNDINITNMTLGDYPEQFSYEGNVEIEFIFNDIEQPVLPVLEDMLHGANEIIRRLSDALTASTAE